MIVVASVPGSATRFVIEHLLAPRRRAGKDSGPCVDSYYFQHLETEHIPSLRRTAAKYPCIIPLRHPVAVALTWKKRRNNIAHLCSQYRALVTALDPLHPFYLPVDVPNRQKYLDLINAEAGLNLVTDWPVWKPSGEKGKFAGRDRELIADLQTELEHFFSRFGYD